MHTHLSKRIKPLKNECEIYLLLFFFFFLRRECEIYLKNVVSNNLDHICIHLVYEYIFKKIMLIIFIYLCFEQFCSVCCSCSHNYKGKLIASTYPTKTSKKCKVNFETFFFLGILKVSLNYEI